MTKQISFKQRWLSDQYRKLRMVYSQDEISSEDIKNMLLEEYDKRYQAVGRFVNNVDRTDSQMTVEQFINVYMNRDDCVMSGYSTLFKDSNHSSVIALKALKFLLDTRSKYKKEMVKYEVGSDMYIYYDTLQKDYKILANSYYGICSLDISPFFNPYVQNSITMSGQDIITTSISTMESFLSNSNTFDDMDDIYEFVMNVSLEKTDESILNWIDRPVTSEELIDEIRSHTTGEINEIALNKLVSGMDDELRSKVFYKNHIAEFCANTKVKEHIGKVVSTEFAGDELICKIVCDYCLYDAILDDKYKRSLKQPRKSVLVVDTDSNFLYLDPEIKAISEIIGKDDDSTNLNITNMVIAIITEALKRIYWTLTSSLAVPDDHKPIINMKNEFCYSRIMLTRNKKNYAGLVTVKLGKRLSDPRLDIKGLAIRKSTVGKSLRDKFTDLLVYDILSPKKIEIRKVMKDFDLIGDTVRDSLKTGSTEYATPKSLQTFDNYKNPERIDSLRGAIMWNELEPENSINPPETVSMVPLIVGTNKDCKPLQDMKLTDPKKYGIIMKRAFTAPSANSSNIDITSFGFDVLSVPKSQDYIPQYILPLIDYETLIAKAMANGNILLESLGVYCSNNFKTNIVRF